MKNARFARPVAHALMVMLMLAGSAWRAAAQTHDDHGGSISSVNTV